ncbi:DUF6382 domain-containing protein [Ruminococcus sp. 5_1_39BFAA]|uniref:DUF6382 domain-containing protein n=1 Tax=Ruminococcus sp. 5_1_39BFAA TaxID=457412 RepID=UPI003563D7E4
MMRAEYKRDMNHNFLILHEEEEIDTGSYQVRMLAGNAIPSVLKCRIQGIDGKFMIYYDITSRQSVSMLFEEKKLDFGDLQLIFGGFVQVMEEMSEYLLNPGRLVIRPEYMYVDLEKRQLFFCYLPGFEVDVRKQFQELTEYILPKLNHEDSAAVMLGYGVYRRALEDGFHLEHIKEELYRERGEAISTEALQKPEKHQEPEIPENLELGEDLWGAEESVQGADKKKAAEEPKKPGKFGVGYKILGCLSGAAVAMAVISAKVMGYLPGIPMEMLLGGIIVTMGVSMLTYAAFSRRKRERAEAVSLAVQEKSNTDSLFEKAAATEAVKSECGDRMPKNRKEVMTVWPMTARQEAWKDDEDDRQEPENYGETVVLSANISAGPSSLVSREPGELATIYLKDELTVIGKLANAADAVINLPTVSRVHAKIRNRNGEYYLTDLNSRNGTSVNGQMLRPDEDYQLKDQDEVDFAQARYVFLK